MAGPDVIDGRTPVIVAANQHNARTVGSEPIGAMVEALRPVLDAGEAERRLASRLGAVRVVQGIWPYRDAGRLVAEELDLGAVSTAVTRIGGNECYDLVASTAADIQAGDLDVAVICAAEVGRTRRKLKAAGERPPYRQEAPDVEPDLRYGDDVAMVTEQQLAVGAGTAVAFYALAESVLRHERGETLEDHRRRIAELWAGASRVAADNPHAWLREPVTADQVATVSAANRPVADPYPKLMTSNIDVDQSAAVLVCSLEAAQDAGVPASAMVFPISASGAHDPWAVLDRWALHESPAMAATGHRALELAERTVEEIDDLDLYSCFPSAVQVAQRELGIDPARPFTITGGLTFAGGPLNSYCLHALATAVERIGRARASSALLTGNGGFFTKHSCIVLGSEPPAHGFRHDRPQSQVDAHPVRSGAIGEAGVATVEAATVTFDRDGAPDRAIATVLDDAGARRWAFAQATDVVAAVLDSDVVGSAVELAPDHDSGAARILGLR